MTETGEREPLPAMPLSPFVLIKGAGEMASAIAWRLYMANIRRICMLELERPLCVRREVSFCRALESGPAAVESVEAVAALGREAIEAAWGEQRIAVALASDWARNEGFDPGVVIDAILAKRNLGTTRDEAPLVIALGPGFEAGKDCHAAIETDRGHDLGRIIVSGRTAPNTGVPGNIAGHTDTRVLRAPVAGVFETDKCIGDPITTGAVVGQVAGHPVAARVDGVLRGLIRAGTEIPAGLKVGDIDPRGVSESCYTISDKARAIAGSALEAVLRHYNHPASPA